MPLKDPVARKAYQAAYRAADLGRRTALVAARHAVHVEEAGAAGAACPEGREAEAPETNLAMLRESQR